MQPYIFTIGNIKGGAGKTTMSMHLISGLLDLGFNVSSIDVDSHQHSLTSYIEKRKSYKDANRLNLPMPMHFLVRSLAEGANDVLQDEKNLFEQALDEAKKNAQIIIIDTAGSLCNLSCLAHSYADTIITPINDSFLDLDLLAEIEPDSLKIKKLSIYSEMVWKQKLQRANRDKGSIQWIIIRNRLSSMDTHNKRAVASVMQNFAKRLKCVIGQGFQERVIFKELFLKGLTLFDVKHVKIPLTVSHVAARQEMRNFMKCIGVDSLVEKCLSSPKP